MMWKFCMNIWVFLSLSFPWVRSQDGGDVSLEVITASSPCSATCGLGLRSQTLCLLKDSKAALEEKTQGTKGPEVTQECRVRQVQCLDSWQCGLRTLTVTEGQSLNIDCVEEVLKEMGPYSWRVSWHYARGVITTDDSLFTRWEAPDLDHVVLDPVQEKHAGTYRCDVQDAGLRRVKRIYWGVRVLPPGVINLDMQRSEDRCGRAGDHCLNQTHNEATWTAVLLPVLTFGVPLLFVVLYKKRSIQSVCVRLLSSLCKRQDPAPTNEIPLNDLQEAV